MPESIDPHEAVDLYLKDHKPEVTESTYRNHKYHLKRFLEWCEESGFDDMSDMTGKRIYEYKMFLRFCESLNFVAEGTADSVMMPGITLPVRTLKTSPSK